MAAAGGVSVSPYRIMSAAGVVLGLLSDSTETLISCNKAYIKAAASATVAVKAHLCVYIEVWPVSPDIVEWILVGIIWVSR